MSTLGDLLAEHTVLPGNAVDHLHALVGEWQLLADLSFADYLMWVRRDDGVLVCVAQVQTGVRARRSGVGARSSPGAVPAEEVAEHAQRETGHRCPQPPATAVVHEVFAEGQLNLDLPRRDVDEPRAYRRHHALPREARAHARLEVRVPRYEVGHKF